MTKNDEGYTTTIRARIALPLVLCTMAVLTVLGFAPSAMAQCGTVVKPGYIQPTLFHPQRPAISAAPPASHYQKPVKHGQNVVVQPIYNTVVVPAYTFQFLPAVATYTTPVVPPLSVITGLAEQQVQPASVISPTSQPLMAAPGAAGATAPPAATTTAEVDDGPPVAVDPAGAITSAPMPPPLPNVPSAAPAVSRAATPPAKVATARPVDLTPYGIQIVSARCASCHSGVGREGVSFFDNYGNWKPTETWGRIYRAVANNRMPPAARGQPAYGLPQQEKEILKAIAARE